MVIISESARSLKGFVAKAGLKSLAAAMVLRMVLAFIGHRGQLTRFLARPRWQKIDFNAPLRRALLDHEASRLEGKPGRYIFIADVTLVSQAGVKTQNTHGTGNTAMPTDSH